MTTLVFPKSRFDPSELLSLWLTPAVDEPRVHVTVGDSEVNYVLRNKLVLGNRMFLFSEKEGGELLYAPEGDSPFIGTELPPGTILEIHIAWEE